MSLNDFNNLPHKKFIYPPYCVVKINHWFERSSTKTYFLQTIFIFYKTYIYIFTNLYLYLQTYIYIFTNLYLYKLIFIFYKLIFYILYFIFYILYFYILHFIYFIFYVFIFYILYFIFYILYFIFYIYILYFLTFYILYNFSRYQNSYPYMNSSVIVEKKSPLIWNRSSTKHIFHNIFYKLIFIFLQTYILQNLFYKLIFYKLIFTNLYFTNYILQTYILQNLLFYKLILVFLYNFLILHCLSKNYVIPPYEFGTVVKTQLIDLNGHLTKHIFNIQTLREFQTYLYLYLHFTNFT
jgi:hypothetical protein